MQLEEVGVGRFGRSLVSFRHDLLLPLTFRLFELFIVVLFALLHDWRFGVDPLLCQLHERLIVDRRLDGSADGALRILLLALVRMRELEHFHLQVGWVLRLVMGDQ